MNALLKHEALNGWRLFWLISAPIAIIMIVAMAQTDTWGAASVSALIKLSVRWSVPWLYLAFAASSLQQLCPGTFTNWLLRNRKIMGLSFAAAMAWQLFFILWLVTGYTDYYVEEVYTLQDAIEGVVSYSFLIAMTVTSFKCGRKRLQPKSWRWLHTGGIYFVWAYVYGVYWSELFYYPAPEPMDFVYYWAGFLTWGLRAAAWRKKRLSQAEKEAPTMYQLPVFKFMGCALVACGIWAAGFGAAWRASATDILTGSAITHLPETFLPYWPFEPFLPLCLIALGVYLTVGFRRRPPGSPALFRFPGSVRN